MMYSVLISPCDRPDNMVASLALLHLILNHGVQAQSVA
jgi:hypothetical protein